MQPQVADITALRAAIQYYDAGYCVVMLHSRIVGGREDGTDACSCGDSACRNQGKHPRFKNWAEKAAKSTKEQLKKDLIKHPDSNIGLLCGDWSRIPHPDKTRVRKWIVCLDVDAKLVNGGVQTGLDTLSEWEDGHGKLPATPSAKTPSGGAHYLFAHPGTPVPTRSGVLAGIDVRGDNNGQIVVQPSPGYAWDSSPWEPLAAMPTALIELVVPRPDAPPSSSPDVPDDPRWPPPDVRLRRARAWIATQSGAVAGQGGHTKTFTTAQLAIRGFALSFEQGLSLLREYSAKCTPPWSEKELRHKVESAIKDGTFPWGKQLGIPSAAPAPAHDPETGEVVDSDYRSKLIMNAKGEYVSNLANAVTILSGDPAFDCIRFNDFEARTTLERATPAHTFDDEYPRAWRDVDDVAVATYLQREWQLNLSPMQVAQSVQQVAIMRRHHPVRYFLQHEAGWDGVIRLDRWLIDWFGAPDTEYIRAISVMWPIAAVARIFEPGCQVDTIVTLEGEQGLGKSTGIAALSPVPSWYTDELAEPGSKDAAQCLLGKWIIELPELSQFERVGLPVLKAFATRKTDHFRPSYGRHTIDQPRQCIFVGTTNKDDYLTDETGNRRFWPVKCSKIDIAAIKAHNKLFWGEAVARYESKEPWWIVANSPLAALAEAEQEARMHTDPWQDAISAWLACGKAKELILLNGYITTSDVLWHCLCIDKAKWDKSSQTRVGNCMRLLGYTRRRYSVGDSRVWGYYRG